MEMTNLTEHFVDVLREYMQYGISHHHTNYACDWSSLPSLPTQQNMADINNMPSFHYKKKFLQWNALLPDYQHF